MQILGTTPQTCMAVVITFPTGAGISMGAHCMDMCISISVQYSPNKNKEGSMIPIELYNIVMSNMKMGVEVFWLFVVAHLCLQHWGIEIRSCWLNVLFCLASNLSEVGEACCFSVSLFVSSFHLTFLSMSLQHSSGRGFCLPSLWTIKPSKSILKHSLKFYPVREYLPPPISFGWAYPKYLESAALHFQNG